MKKIALAVIGILFSSLLFTPGAGAGQTSQDSVKLRSTEVFVDAVVFDRKARLVTDLSVKDFEIYEDGIAQEITSFQVFRGAINKPGQSPGPQPALAESRPETSAPAREIPNLLIVLLDYSTTRFENQKPIQEASIRYVEEKLQPNDMIAVFILGSGLRLLTDFTNDKSKLIEALKTADATGSGLATDRANMSATIETGKSETMSISDSAPASIPSGPAAAAAAASLSARVQSLGDSIIAQHLASLDFALRAGLDRRQSLGVLSAIRAIAKGVKEIEGRKTLLLFSEGFVVGPSVEEQLHSVVSLANQSQLAIYSIESQGLETRELSGNLVPRDELTSTISNLEDNKRARGGETVFDRARQVGPNLRDSPLRYISNATGGFLIRNTNDLGVGLERVNEEMRSYYLLSYRPGNEKLDGRFREIRVNVKRADLSVRARSGYYAVPTAYDFLSPEEYQLVEQAHSQEFAPKMPLFLRVAGFQQESNQYRIPVILEIPSTSIRFDKGKNKNSARLMILGLVRSRGGDFVKRFGGSVQVDLTDAVFESLKPGTMSFINYVELPAGDYYSFEVLVKDLLSSEVSGGRQALYLRPPEPTLALSTILLAKEVDQSLSATGQFLTVGEVKIMPSARCQFRNGDNLIFYFDIYNPQPGGESRKTDVSISLSLTRDGQAVNARLPGFHLDDAAAQTFPRITFARYLRLNGLAPGAYNLIIEVKDNLGNQVARGQAPFSLVK